ncbi:MAG TPA: RNA polymerase sigma-54 factor [Nitrospirae bacterium]|nr:RNA polymerase sigma-54 factor [Nitrospirota bacterium]
MALETRLDLKLAQKLVLTPQLQQAIKLLQLPQLELTQAINQELAENPFLEEVQEEEVQAKENEKMEETEENTQDDLPLPLERLMSFRVDEYFEERSSDGRDLGYFNPGIESQPSFEQFLSTSSTLYDHLQWQLRLLSVDDKIKEIAEVVIGNLDDNGYLRLTDEELSRISNSSVDDVRRAVRVVQELDPPGVGARDLRECLLIQIRALGLGNTLVEKIVMNNLHDLEKRNYNAIARKYNSPIEDVMMAVEIISGLDPKPARNFSSQEINYIVPDVFVIKTDDGYQITLNNEGIPRLRINSYYRRLLNKKDLSKEEKKFLRERYRSADWLLKSLDQRNKTIYKVTESILKFQREFFDKGPQYVKPLNLRDVAEDINMHESTISRVTLNKYLACSHGIFSFRFFFSSALKGENGSVSSTVVKEMIKKIIDEEDPRKPYSDQKIADMLKEKNIKIARRTVAKYREEMRIPSHTHRRRVDI